MARRIVIITGATQGLGRALVEGFANAGHTVLGCARTRKDVDRLSREFPSPHDFYAVDVSSDEAVKSWASLLLTTHGAPDLLLNNAGIINKNARLWEIGAAEFSEVVDINLKGTANVLRYFLPAMVRRKVGVVVNLSSGWGRSADPEMAPYCASKWAIEGLTLALSQELPSSMAAVALNPGLINTRMLQSCLGKAAASHPSPETWAKSAVPFLLNLGPTDNGKQLEMPPG